MCRTTRRGSITGMSRLGLLVVALAGSLGAHCVSTAVACAQSDDTEDDSREFWPRRVVPAKPPITDPPLLRGEQALAAIADNELVLGVVVNGEARAYPINMLNGPSREIINDLLGGVPIAATWCHLCHNTVVFDRRVNGQTLVFAVSGKLWNRNLVMVDTETESQWSHFLGRAMDGPLMGARLSTLPSELTTWGQWRRAHENSTVLNLPRSSKSFVRDVHRKSEDFVYGFVVDGRAHHASFAALQKHVVLNLELRGHPLLIAWDPAGTSAQLFERSLDEQLLTFIATAAGPLRDHPTGSLWSPATGTALSGPLQGRSLTQQVGMPAFAEAWTTFYPNSQEVPAGISSSQPPE